jgi:SAM-dependent methyltransferase
MLPYIIRQWEPSSTKLTCVDLSRRSLRRAQFRTALLGRSIIFQQSDVNEYLSRPDKSGVCYDHIEAYGVLHHISSFQKTLNLIRHHLSPNGIVRIMVYNAKARDWIWELNRGFVQLGLRFNSDADVKTAREILFRLASISPQLDERLQQMGLTSLNNNTRFADTFLHPWESRASIIQWFKAFSSAGLKPVGLYDRYAELDDLDNPLWTCPTAEQLSERAQDLRFENNLEVWLKRENADDGGGFHNSSSHAHRGAIPLRLRMTMPPNQFNKFEETRPLPIGTKLAIWQGYLRNLHQIPDKTSLGILSGLDLRVLKRIARIGLLLPQTAAALKLTETLSKPLHPNMSPPKLAPRATPKQMEKISEIIGNLSINEQHLNQALRRFTRAI